MPGDGNGSGAPGNGGGDGQGQANGGQPAAGTQGAGNAEELSAEQALELVKAAYGEKGPDGQPFDPKRAIDAIKSTAERAETAERERDSIKRERDQHAQRLKEIDESTMSETEKANRRAEELDNRTKALEAENRTLRAQGQIEAVARGDDFKAENATAVWKLVDKDAIEFDDDGKVTNASTLVAKVRTEAPQLFRGGVAPGGGDGGAHGTGSDGLSMNDRIRQAAGKA